MNATTKKNVEDIKHIMRCSTPETFKYLDYNDQINRDCMGNIKEFLPKILYPQDSTKEFEKFKVMCMYKVFR